MSLILLSLVMFLLEFVSSAQYPLINKNNYMYLAPEGNSNKVDISNPWRFNFIDTTGLIKHWGYEGEEHSVTTEDGYIISIYHIVPKQNNSPPVLIMHGLLANSESFLARGEKDLPILLTEAGYDVWVGNFRGNNNGKRHVNMTSDNEDFWKFSFHELGIYDLPAFVDYILDRSSFSKMTIIAHSLANAATLVMTSTKPEYNDKINLFVGLAPYVFAVNFPPGPLAEPLLRSAVRYCNRVRKFEIFETRSINPLVRICDIIPLPCAFIYLLLLGITDIKYDLSFVSVISGFFPAGTSIFNIIHAVALYRLGRFCQFDHGRNENLIRYNSEEPPDYNLTRVTIPVVLFSGGRDLLLDPRDLKRLEKSLVNLIGSYRINSYNHFDLVIAHDTKEMMYDHIVEIIGQNQEPPLVNSLSTKRTPRSPG